MGRAGRERTGHAPAAARALGAVALVALLASCGSSGAVASGAADAQEARAAVVVPSADCLAPEVLDALGLRLDASLAATASSRAATAVPGAVPDDFDPTGALVCQVGGKMLDGAGTWTVVTATSREGSAADLAAVVAALAAPVATDVRCEQRAPIALWLVDAMDRAVRPVVPVDSCGAPSAAVLAALGRLAVTGVVDHPVELVAPSPDAS